MHTKTREYRTARRICVARVPGWILTTRHSLSIMCCRKSQKSGSRQSARELKMKGIDNSWMEYQRKRIDLKLSCAEMPLAKQVGSQTNGQNFIIIKSSDSTGCDSDYCG